MIRWRCFGGIRLHTSYSVITSPKAPGPRSRRATAGMLVLWALAVLVVAGVAAVSALALILVVAVTVPLTVVVVTVPVPVAVAMAVPVALVALRRLWRLRLVRLGRLLRF